MATVRERDPACHGVGHADRSWLDYAFGVDTQSRGVRLPPNERGESNPNPDSHCRRYGDANSNSYSYSDTYTDRHGYNCSKADPDSTTAA